MAFFSFSILASLPLEFISDFPISGGGGGSYFLGCPSQNHKLSAAADRAKMRTLFHQQAYTQVLPSAG
jgi:hypothetical protein